jgi:hypothetical protein
MLGDLITLPVRLSARAATFALQSSERIVSQALTLAGLVARRGGGGEPDTRSETRASNAAPEREQAQPSSANGDGAPAGVDPRRRDEPLHSGNGAERAAVVEPEVSPPAGPVEVAPAPVEEPAEPEAEAVHVSEEPELVQEVAEAGAEDGAGAQVTVAEPWEGYAGLNAKDVIDRLAAASPEELAAVSLYESTHQSRQTVLTAVERQLQLSSRGGSSD